MVSSDSWQLLRVQADHFPAVLGDAKECLQSAHLSLYSWAATLHPSATRPGTIHEGLHGTTQIRVNLSLNSYWWEQVVYPSYLLQSVSWGPSGLENLPAQRKGLSRGFPMSFVNILMDV